MALTPSSMMPLGTPAPDFLLPDTVSGRTLAFRDVQGESGTLVMFICNHCPFVIHIREGLAALGRDYQDSGIGIVAISANDVETHPEDSPENMQRFARESGFVFPYLYDESQAVAQAYGAACTPDFFLFDGRAACVYRGCFDASRLGNDVPVTGDALRGAMQAVLAGDAVDQDQQPSMGCNIKWKS
jgi:peroxiredoxin